MARPPHIPERTCVGCRRRAPASELARFALHEGRMVMWAPELARPRRHRPGGRGASLHAEAACLDAALKTGAFARAFRGQLRADAGNLDSANLFEQLTAAAAALRSVNRNKS